MHGAEQEKATIARFMPDAGGFSEEGTADNQGKEAGASAEPSLIFDRKEAAVWVKIFI